MLLYLRAEIRGDEIMWIFTPGRLTWCRGLTALSGSVFPRHPACKLDQSLGISICLLGAGGEEEERKRIFSLRGHAPKQNNMPEASETQTDPRPKKAVQTQVSSRRGVPRRETFNCATIARLVWAAGGPARRLSSVPFVQALCSVSKGRMASAFSLAA